MRCKPGSKVSSTIGLDHSLIGACAATRRRRRVGARCYSWNDAREVVLHWKVGVGGVVKLTELTRETDGRSDDLSKCRCGRSASDVCQRLSCFLTALNVAIDRASTTVTARAQQRTGFFRHVAPPSSRVPAVSSRCGTGHVNAVRDVVHHLLVLMHVALANSCILTRQDSS